MLNMLRLEGRRQAGGELTDQEDSNLESFKRRLKEQGAVVTYIRDTDEGWFLVKARPIDTGMIRIP
jgi:lauroyl/myristoyl acyltransferase